MDLSSQLQYSHVKCSILISELDDLLATWSNYHGITGCSLDCNRLGQPSECCSSQVIAFCPGGRCLKKKLVDLAFEIAVELSHDASDECGWDAATRFSIVSE